MLLTQTFLQDLRGCPSFSRCLDDQSFSGGTDTYENARQDELGLENGLHPTGCQGLEMTHEFEPTQLTLFLHPELGTHLWTEGSGEEHEAHATIQITEGRVFFVGRENGSMKITLPGLNNAFAWPPHRIDLADRVRGPDAGWDIGHQEVPGQQRQMGCGRGIAFLLRRLLGVPPTFIDDRCWDSRRHETRGHPRVFPQANSAL